MRRGGVPGRADRKPCPVHGCGRLVSSAAGGFLNHVRSFHGRWALEYLRPDHVPLTQAV